MNGNDIRHWIVSETGNHGISEAERETLIGLDRAQIQAYLRGDTPYISEEALKLLSALDLEFIVRPRDTPGR